MKVIDDSNWQDFVEESKDLGKGWVERDIATEPFGSSGLQFDQGMLIPRNEWSSRIRDLKQAGLLVGQQSRAAGIQIKNQQQTLFCWAYGPTLLLEMSRVAAGLPHVALSSASVACYVGGFRNQGGWGTKALRHLVSSGAVPRSIWPEGNKGFSRAYDTQQARQSAMLLRAENYIDLPPGRFDVLMSCLLRRRPCAPGYGWWGHLLAAVDPVDLGGGEFGVDHWNSWDTSYGNQGCVVIHERRCVPNDLCCVTGPLTSDLQALRRIVPNLTVV